MFLPAAERNVPEFKEELMIRIVLLLTLVKEAFFSVNYCRCIKTNEGAEKLC